MKISRKVVLVLLFGGAGIAFAAALYISHLSSPGSSAKRASILRHQRKIAGKYLVTPNGKSADPSKEMLLTFGDGQVFRLDSVPAGTVLLDQDGCKIIMQDQAILVFNRINATEDSGKTFFDSVMRISVPDRRNVLVIVEGGPRIELFDKSELSFAPGDEFHPFLQRPISLEGSADFLIPGAFFLKTRNLSIANKKDTAFTWKTFSIRCHPGDDEFNVKSYAGYLEVDFRDSNFKISPGLMLQNKKNSDRAHVVNFQNIFYPRKYREGYLEFTDSTAPQVLRELVKWYGLKGFRIEGLDTMKRNVLGAASLHKWLSLSQLFQDIETSGVHYSYKDDSIIVSSTPLEPGLKLSKQAN